MDPEANRETSYNLLRAGLDFDQIQELRKVQKPKKNSLNKQGTYGRDSFERVGLD